MQRTPSAPTVAACAVCGGSTSLSPGPSSMSLPAVGTRSGRARNTAPFRSRAHASRRYRRARYPTRAGSDPRRASGLRSGLRPAACHHAARPRHHGPSQNLITAARVVCRRGTQPVAVADCADRERGIMQVIRHGEQLDSSRHAISAFLPGHGICEACQIRRADQDDLHAVARPDDGLVRRAESAGRYARLTADHAQ